MKTRNALLIILIVSLSLFACTGNQKPAPSRAQVAYYDHVVKYQGETLGLIAAWYTGSANNWRTILDHNTTLNPKKIRPGDLVQIPDSIMTRRTPLQKKFIGGGKPAAQTQDASTQDAATSQDPSLSDVAVDNAPETTGSAENAPTDDQTASLPSTNTTTETTEAAAVNPPDQAASEPETNTAPAQIEGDTASPTDLSAESERIKKREELLQELIGQK